MMSPLSVSQFLGPGLRFDLIIFDEASQVRPSDAINCIYRGQRLIIAGDEHQLPPSSFFDYSRFDGDDEYDEEQLEVFESVLDVAKAGGLKSLSLRWHYRSQDEALITFSNYSFYEGKLMTFPPATHEAPDLGVSLFPVDGIYRRGTTRDNPIEAEAVIDRVLYHAMTHPDLTLGVVAFSEAQASTIDYLLEQRRRQHPELDSFFDSENRLHGFFIKNLENVQGDERDIMIFSIGYGEDEVGKFTMNFGPLNRVGGERRLNVAITRARRRVEVVSSITPSTFPSIPKAQGARHLLRYLDYAMRGAAALAIDFEQPELDVESPFEDEVLRVIRSWGYDVTPQVGVARYRIDLGVRHPDSPGMFALGIECDGAMYHSSRVARDRDRLRQEVLERLGWQLHRIWGPSWYRSRDKEKQRLQNAIEAAIGRDQTLPFTRQAAAPVAVELAEVDLDGPPNWTVPYPVANLPRTRKDEIKNPLAWRDMERHIIQIAKTEGPVSIDTVLRRLREAWGIGRAGSQIRQTFDTALRSLIRRKEIAKSRDGFISVPDHQLTAVRVPVPGDKNTQRSAADVPPEEFQLAIRRLLCDAKTATWDEMSRRVANLFGWGRRGVEISGALDRAVRALKRNGSVVDSGGTLSLGPSSDP